MTYEVRQFDIVTQEPINEYTIIGSRDLVAKTVKERLKESEYALIDWHTEEESLHMIFFYQVKACLKCGELVMSLESLTSRKTL